MPRHALRGGNRRPRSARVAGEGAHFSEWLENASLYVERGLALTWSVRYSPPERVPWRNGFAAIGGRCFPLSRGDAFLRHALSGLREAGS